MKKTTCFILLSVGLLILSCGSPEGGTIQVAPKNIPASEALLLVEDTSILTLDVRTQEEIANGYIEGTDLFIDVNLPDFNARIATLDKNKTYLVYCHGGKRSAKAANILSEAGFQNIYNMTGGYSTWTGPVHR